MGLKRLFSEYASTQQSHSPFLDLTEQNAPGLLPSSSSSSLRSLSAESPDSSHIFTIPTTSSATLQPISDTAAAADPYPHAMQALSEIRNLKLPTIESEESAMTRAFLAVLTSPSSSSCSTPTLHQQRAASAFRRYFSFASASGASPSDTRKKQSLFKRAIIYYRRLNLARQVRIVGGRPTSSQLHHMMSERKRRETLNKNFQTLRSLLPMETKRDKASLLTSAKQQLSALKAQIAELGKKNQLLEAQLSPSTMGASGDHGGVMSPSAEHDVRITYVSESSTSGEHNRTADVKLRVRREYPMVDTLIRLLEFLKGDRNVSLASVEAHKSIDEISAPHYVNFRLKIEGEEWEESAFLEAVRRLVNDLAQSVK